MAGQLRYWSLKAISHSAIDIAILIIRHAMILLPHIDYQLMPLAIATYHGYRHWFSLPLHPWWRLFTDIFIFCLLIQFIFWPLLLAIASHRPMAGHFRYWYAVLPLILMADAYYMIYLFWYWLLILGCRWLPIAITDTAALFAIDTSPDIDFATVDTPLAATLASHWLMPLATLAFIDFIDTQLNIFTDWWLESITDTAGHCIYCIALRPFW